VRYVTSHRRVIYSTDYPPRSVRNRAFLAGGWPCYAIELSKFKVDAGGESNPSSPMPVRPIKGRASRYTKPRDTQHTRGVLDPHLQGLALRPALDDRALRGWLFRGRRGCQGVSRRLPILQKLPQRQLRIPLTASDVAEPNYIPPQFPDLRRAPREANRLRQGLKLFVGDARGVDHAETKELEAVLLGGEDVGASVGEKGRAMLTEDAHAGAPAVGDGWTVATPIGGGHPRFEVKDSHTTTPFAAHTYTGPLSPSFWRLKVCGLLWTSCASLRALIPVPFARSLMGVGALC
jgi:hypothetical protein